MTKRRWLRELTAGTILGVFLATIVWAATQTINVLPTSNATFLPDLQTFLRNEDAQRYNHQFQGFVVQNGLHGTAAGLTVNPGDTIAYPGGFYARETASITYPDASTCWVIMHSDVSENLATFVRVSGTKYLRDCTSGAQPTVPVGTVYLMRVTTAAGAVTAVTDLRLRTPVSVTSGGTGLVPPFVVGDLFYASSTSLWGRLPDVVDGSVLRSAGIGATPIYGKVRLSGPTTDISGQVGPANGGLGTSATPTNGQVPIGNGTGFTLAALTAGSNINIVNGPGTVTVSATAPLSTGTWASRGLLAFNNTGTPNTRLDISADSIVLRNASNEVTTRHGTGVTLTNDVALAGPTANGRDQAGAFSASSWVHFYWICCNPDDASLSSATAPATGPVLPSGYTLWAYVGAIRFNGSSQLVRSRIRGNVVYYDAMQSALADGRATAEAAISLTALIPPNAHSGLARARLRSSAATGKLVLRVITATDFWASPDVGDATYAFQFAFPNVSQQVLYLFTADPGATLGLYFDVEGYRIPNGGD